ncbi:MAG: hypothetical protein H6779_00610 [Candidatus Nomurabacteria bacterium]|nr:hypothetical protein [Candidatus Nomurabacteria bacterium]USN87931.1 MAG: hypothetical protein H6779_00610 [Candidatus Nomurabacteria bacterium]
MGFFSSSDDSIEYAAVIDIGSGSVLASIVESDVNKTHPNIIWAKREYSPLKQIDSLSKSIKNVMTSFMSVMMLLDSEGRARLKEVAPRAKIKTLQVTIVAPWSYTVSKTILYSKENEFSVTKGLLDELLRMAEQKVQVELKENEKIHEQGLELISRTTADVIANGYSVRVSSRQKAKSLKVVQLNAITQESIVQEVEEVKDKLFPAADPELYSFMMAFYYTISDLYPEQREYCLVDVTYEATEIGVVRDGILQYCTNIPFGSISLARELSAILSVPLQEAHNYLAEPDLDTLLIKYSSKQKEDVKAVIEAYEAKLVELFHETGDKLSIPKSLFMHCDNSRAEFFKDHIVQAANLTTKSSHVVYNVTGDLLTQRYSKDKISEMKKTKLDTAMLISAQFFHTNSYDRDFEQL